MSCLHRKRRGGARWAVILEEMTCCVYYWGERFTYLTLTSLQLRQGSKGPVRFFPLSKLPGWHPLTTTSCQDLLYRRLLTQTWAAWGFHLGISGWWGRPSHNLNFKINLKWPASPSHAHSKVFKLCSVLFCMKRCSLCHSCLTLGFWIHAGQIQAESRLLPVASFVDQSSSKAGAAESGSAHCFITSEEPRRWCGRSVYLPSVRACRAKSDGVLRKRSGKTSLLAHSVLFMNGMCSKLLFFWVVRQRA